jgi:hypothetical protein
MPTRTRLSDDQLAELLSLLDGADSVELKLTVPDSTGRQAVRALDMDPLDAQIRQVVFFDTPDLALNGAGLVVRARRIQGRGDDSVVKLRPVVPSEMPKKLRSSPNFGVEVDALPGGYVCSASMKHQLPGGGVREVLTGNRSIRKVFSKEQRSFFAAHAPSGLELEGLSILGPILVLKLKFTTKGFDGKLVAELWLYPDGSRILELSTKTVPADALIVAAKARVFLTEKGIDLSGVQQTKTKTALTFFARELQST